MNLLNRRGLLALSASLCLSACNSMTATSIESINLAIKGKINEIPLDQIKSVEADSILIQAGAAEGLFVAPAGSIGRIEWLGLSEQVQTDHGRVTQLVGTATDVLSPLLAKDPFITGLLNVPEDTQVLRYVDYPLAYQTGLEQYATYKRGPLEEIKIFNSSLPHQRIDERIWMPQLHYKATNYYWVDPKSGSIRRSIQHVSPELPALDITLTRPSGARSTQ